MTKAPIPKIWLITAFLAAVTIASLSAYGLAKEILAPPEKAEPDLIATTSNPKLGVHTRLTDEVEPWKIEKTLQMAREMGSAWVVEYFPWNYIQPEAPGQYDWKHSDLVIDAASRQGLKLVARLDGVPSWARPRDTTAKYLDEDHFRDFGQFVYSFVNRYKGKVKYYIIWNEPNLASEWGQRQVDPAGYTELLKVASPRAKQADPNCVVLAAGLAPTLEPRGSEWGVNELDYLAGMYKAGAGKYFDMLAVHSYGLKSPADEPADPQKVNFDRVELVRQLMVANGDTAKKIMITEGGWNDNPRWAHSVRPSQRIEYTLAVYDKALKDWPWLEAINLWAFRFPRPSYGYPDYYTFVTPDFVPKPIYYEVQRYATTGLTEEAKK